MLPIITILLFYISSYTVEIIGLDNNSKIFIDPKHEVIKITKNILNNSIGNLDNQNITQKKKVEFFMKTMQKNTNFDYIVKDIFYSSTDKKVKKSYQEFQDKQKLHNTISAYIMLSCLEFMPQNSKNIKIYIHSIKPIKNSYRIKFSISQKDDKIDYEFYIKKFDSFFEIYKICIMSIDLSTTYRTIIVDKLREMNYNLKRQKNYNLEKLILDINLTNKNKAKNLVKKHQSKKQR